jgi:hypothetical protein
MKRTAMLLSLVLLILSLACAALGGDKTPEPGAEVTAIVERPETATPKSAAEDTPAEPTPTSPPTATPTPPPTPTPAPTETPEEPEDTGFSVDPDAFNELDSYRNEVTMSFESADGETGDVTVLQELVRDLEAQRVVMSFEGDFPLLGEEMEDLAGFEMEIVQIASQQWVRMGEMWVETSPEEGSFDFQDMDELTELIGPEELNDLSDEERLEFVEREEVNGLQTRHYQGEYAEGFFDQLDLDADKGEVEEAALDIWIADAPDLPQFTVRMLLDVKGVIEGEEGTLTVVQNVTDVNQPISIEAPEVTMDEFPEDVPEYAGAEEVNVFGGLISFSTADSVADVADFYREGLEANGWEQTDSTEFGAVMETWNKEGRELSLTITRDDEENLTNVLIIISEEGE